MAEKSYQVCDVKPLKGISKRMSNEILREGSREGWASQQAGNLDSTRSHLNFEVGKGGVIKEVDKKKSLVERFQENLAQRNIDDPNKGLSYSSEDSQPGVGRRTWAAIILGGSRERMRTLAFGNQDVTFEQGADNSGIVRMPAIEQWAIDQYNFLAHKFGEENICCFVCHLDETNPHIHVGILPINEKNRFSYNQFFGGDFQIGSDKTRKLHDELAKVTKKYGLSRGEPTKESGNKHKSYAQWLKESNCLMRESLEEKSEVLKNINGEISKCNTDLFQARKKQKALNTMLGNLEKTRDALYQELQEVTDNIWSTEQEQKAAETSIRQLKVDLQLLEEKIKLRESQLFETADRLTFLEADKKQFTREKEQLLQELEKMREEMRNISSPNFKDAAYEVLQGNTEVVNRKIKEFGNSLPDEEREQLENLLNLSVAEKGVGFMENSIVIASNLFFGYLDQATDFSVSQGGAALPGGGWGRDEDEDDERFRRRCLAMAMKMLNTKGNTKKNVKKNPRLSM